MYKIETEPRLNPDGVLVWSPYLGHPHRDDGPAKIWPDGKKEWWINGERHRDDGPAIIYPNGKKEWWNDGVRHRIDGPAIFIPSHNMVWWYIWGTNFEFEKWCDFANKTDEEIVQLKLQYGGMKNGIQI